MSYNPLHSRNPVAFAMGLATFLILVVIGLYLLAAIVFVAIGVGLVRLARHMLDE